MLHTLCVYVKCPEGGRRGHAHELNLEREQEQNSNDSLRFREDRHHRRCANLGMVTLGKRTRIQKVVGQLPILALSDEVPRERIRNC